MQLSKSHRRTSYRQQLRLPGTALYIYLCRSGGLHPHTIHVWKEPAAAHARSEARHSAALARATQAAPKIATRQMMRHIRHKVEGSQISISVLRSMFDCMNAGNVIRERGTREEEVDERGLSWMATEGMVEPEVFWDLRKMNGYDQCDALIDTFLG